MDQSTPQQDEQLRLWLYNSGLRPSLMDSKSRRSEGAPKNVVETTLSYADKPLPPLPSEPRRFSQKRADDYIHAPDSSMSRLSTSVAVDVKRNQRKSSLETKQPAGRSNDVDYRPRMTFHATDGSVEAVNQNYLSGSKSMRFRDSDEGLANSLPPHMNEVEWSDSAFSVRSSSIYSDDDDLKDTGDCYSSRMVSLSVRKPRISEAKGDLYLQPGLYASARELGHLSHSAKLSLPLRSFSRGDSPVKVATLVALGKEEWERSEALSLPANLTQVEHTNAITRKNDDILARVDSVEFSSRGDLYEITRSVASSPLVLRLEKDEELSRCKSRFSDHSSEAKAEARVTSTACDSIISNIRSFLRSFSLLSRPSVATEQKTVLPSTTILSDEKVTRKRWLSSRIHHLESPSLFNLFKKKDTSR